MVTVSKAALHNRLTGNEAGLSAQQQVYHLLECPSKQGLRLPLYTQQNMQHIFMGSLSHCPRFVHLQPEIPHVNSEAWMLRT